MPSWWKPQQRAFTINDRMGVTDTVPRTVNVTIGGTAPASLLRWSPPALTTPTTITVTATNTIATLTAGQDYILSFAAVRTKRLRVVGGRHVKIVGGEFDIPLGSTTSSTANSFVDSGCAFDFSQQTGTVFVEGVHVHGAGALDSIRSDNLAPSGGATFIIQNCRLECHRIQAVTDVSDGLYHTDGFQCWGGLQGLYMNRVTVVNPYQGGMFGDGALSAVWLTTVLDKVNYRADTTVGQNAKVINFVQVGGFLDGPFTFQDVYYELGPSWTWGSTFVSPGSGTPQGGFYSNNTFGTDGAGRQYAQPNNTTIGTLGIDDGAGGPGRIYRGLVPTGDYMTASGGAGMSYVSPGYAP